MAEPEFQLLSEEEIEKLGPEERMEYLRKVAAHMQQGMDETCRQIEERSRKLKSG